MVNVSKAGGGKTKYGDVLRGNPTRLTEQNPAAEELLANRVFSLADANKRRRTREQIMADIADESGFVDPNRLEDELSKQ